MQKKSTLQAVEFSVIDAAYCRTTNAVDGVGAVAHCDGTAIVTCEDGRKVHVTFRTRYNPASCRFGGSTKPKTDIPAYALHNAALEWLRLDLCRTMRNAALARKIAEAATTA